MDLTSGGKTHILAFHDLHYNWSYYWVDICSSIPVAARSKEWVCGFSLPGIAGSNPDEVIDISILIMLCTVR